MSDRPPAELIATCWTIAGDVRPDSPDNISRWPLEQRIDAAARAGYAGIGFWLGDLQHWRAEGGGRDYRPLRTRLADAGLRQVELEFLSDWFATGERRERSDAAQAAFFEAAGALGARHLKVMPPFGGEDLPADLLAERFARLCEEAARYDLVIALEMIPFSDLPDLPAALDMVARADAANGGLLIDIWHVMRSGGRVEDVADVPARFIKAIELCDADLVRRGSITEDTMRHRHLCGEGEFDVPGFIAATIRAGYDGPYGVEILSDALRQLPLEEAARRSFDTAIARFAPVADGAHNG